MFKRMARFIMGLYGYTGTFEYDKKTLQEGSLNALLVKPFNYPTYRVFPCLISPFFYFPLRVIETAIDAGLSDLQ